jgi:hypothetical protein
MTRLSGWLLAASLMAAFSPPAFAASSGWDGTWSGAWGGSRPTSITILNKRVVSYQYEGRSNPVLRSRVTPTKVTYGVNGVTVTIVRTDDTTARATIHSSEGDGTAVLTRQ